MKAYSLSHLADHVLLRELHTLNGQENATVADVVAHIAEVDERKLYLPAGYPSMFLYCVHELHRSEGAAFNRIRAGRAARRFPAIFHALAEGRLHLSAVVLLATHLTPENVDDLLSAAAHKTRAAIELLLAERFPRPDVPTCVQAVAPAAASDEHAPGHVDALDLQLSPGTVVPSILSNAAMQMEPLTPRAKIAPLSSERFALQVTLNKATHDKLRYAQSLLGHAVPSGEVSEVLDRALDALIEKLEQQKFAATTRARARRSKGNGRYVPAEIRRTVWQRDGGQCTFVSDRGQRCPASTRLELDHVEPVARGGLTTSANLRLRCRAHNQFTAEQAFGTSFMKSKREEAPCRAARTRAEAAAERVNHENVIAGLRQLGFRADEARRGAALSAHMSNASLEARFRLALLGLAPNRARRAVPVASGPA